MKTVALPLFLGSLAVGAVLAVVYLPGRGSFSAHTPWLPTFNAAMNALASVLLVCGWVAIRKKNKNAHRGFMVAALAISTAFLVGYIAHHLTHGESHYQGQGFWRPVYFGLLITHILGSALTLPVLATTLFFRFKGDDRHHREWGRFTLPLWLYVSVTGVIIYFMLYGKSAL